MGYSLFSLLIFVGSFKQYWLTSWFLWSMLIERNLRSLWPQVAAKLYIYVITLSNSFSIIGAILDICSCNVLYDAGESSISCATCGSLCVLRTANTANNRGRKFYKCQLQACNFFVYVNLNLNHGLWNLSLGCSRKIVRVNQLKTFLLLFPCFE